MHTTTTATPIFDQLFAEVAPETKRVVLVAVADRPRPPAFDARTVDTFRQYMGSGIVRAAMAMGGGF